ncbi:hypothetical protein [Sphingomonas sp. MS122]|uniref:hypothetical protein n=1 Tax=Sphingomonas sp. MS122 TaxID=3412683 RepID=UPI003C2ADE58
MKDDTPKDDGDKASVKPGDAGTDSSIEERLEKNPENRQARLDRALDESMDASDPPATTQPVHSHQPPSSSGYDEEKERKIAEERRQKAESE